MKNLRTILLAAGMVCCTMISLKAQDKIAKATPAQIAKDDAEVKKKKKEFGFYKEAPSGLLYSIQEYVKAKGPKPAKYSKVKIQYALKTVDYKQTLHDWGGEKGLIVEVPVDKLPYGLQECIKMMSIGQQCSFIMPTKLAKNKYGLVGGGRALIGMVSLVSVAP